jgi:DNA-binding transcriptional MerR regulator
MKRDDLHQKSTMQVPDRVRGFSEAELVELEARHAAGLSTQEVVELMAAHGERLTEATFRKYVQLGLLPRSVRVGRKGKHRGSQGLYPIGVVRQIEAIRRLMAQGYTIQEIQGEFLSLSNDIEGLSQQLSRLLGAIEQAIHRGGEGVPVDEVASRTLADARGQADSLVDKLRDIERRLAMRARMARAAV